MTDSPAGPSAREPAPPYVGELPFALWHVSEEPGLGRLVPHVPRSNPSAPPLVWAVDSRHLPLYWFPRDCPRVCIWPVSTTAADDRDRFFGQTGADRIHVIESAWLERMRTCSLVAYRLPTGPFRPHSEVGGYWVADTPVEALDRIAVGDLLIRHVEAAIELRVTPSIRPFWERVVASTVEFSGIRLPNALV
jgi:hypothetical protein